MPGVLDGIRVLEVASWTFVPAAGAVLSDWGADVIKVEHPQTGDPQRGLVTSGLIGGKGGMSVNFMIEQPNRGKRSVGLDIATEGGRELLYKLAEVSDVFLTNFMPAARRRLQIDVEHIRARNPKIIYARGTGQGVRGPDAEKGGYDGASYWGRGGLGYALTPPSLEYPVSQRPATGDLPGGMTIAGGIAAALFRRERTGEPSIVDISLLGFAAWVLSPDIVAAGIMNIPMLPTGGGDRKKTFNPVVGAYKTKDDRHLALMLLESDKFWPDLCNHLGRPDLITDERFADAKARFENGVECVTILDEIFASKTLDEWKQVLDTLEGVWAPYQSPRELFDDPQVIANGYTPELETADGTKFKLVANPVQFDETEQPLRPAPEHGQHTEEVMLELGLTWEQIAEHKESGALL
jgi:crotonobetainyl-CoA:carnitine CoA-transferase CaiB-like acyl-CoA transferase